MPKMKKQKSNMWLIAFTLITISFVISHTIVESQRPKNTFDENFFINQTDSIISLRCNAIAYKIILLEKEFDNKLIDTIYIQQILK